ncbi:uncharacterized protein LOC101778615 isoform X2 [Setaria italica]|nr:uncharacterized protein LOC101778615 isoform X2 [Setaria italica]
MWQVGLTIGALPNVTGRKMDQPVFYQVDMLINLSEFGDLTFHERLGVLMPWTEIPALDEKVAKWSKEHPVIFWNAGIGPAASFLPTLTRLLFERTKDLYGPYDHIIRLTLTPAAAADSSSAQHWLAFETLIQMARSLKIALPDDKLQELKQLVEEESYFSYGTVSDNLMLQAFGYEYVDSFGSDPSDLMWDPSFGRLPRWSPEFERIMKAFLGKKHLLLVENLHVPVPLDVLFYTMGGRRPSPFQSRWLISTTSEDVCDKSREARTRSPWEVRLSREYYREYYHALPFHDLLQPEWAVLIKEALVDAAASIHNTLKQQGDEFWLHVAQHCLYYGVLYHRLQGAAGCQASTTFSVTSDELVRCLVAEELIFSTTSPTRKPAATGKKQSNYYRSAYEAGKVVVQALQEYSLLPIYSVSTPTSSTSWTATTTSASSFQDTITGVSQLAKGVSRLKQDELYVPKRREKLRWVSFMNGDGRHVSWDWRRKQMAEFIPGKVSMSTLILRGCSNISGFPFDEVLNSFICVLDLSYTPIDSLPPGFSQLLNLNLLSLRGCSQLETLSPSPPSSDEETSPLAHLENLQVLDMNGVPLLEITQQDGSNKRNLHYLDLSGSRITTLPSEFFHSMLSLEELILGHCSNLKELPPSMAELYNLLFLHVEGTKITSFPEDMFEAMQRLRTLKLIDNTLLTSLPRSLSESKGLKELHIYNCIGLRLQFIWDLLPYLEDLYIQTWEALEDIKIHDHRNLRTFSPSGPWIRCLSLRGCSRLKTVNFSDDLTALEDVDLSGTALEEIPHSLPNLPKLKTLLLLNVPCFKRFPWHQLVRFPEVFYLDHCADDHKQFLKMFCKQEICEDENQHTEITTNTAQININDSRIFHSFNADAANKLVKEGQFLQSFNVQVKPCNVRGKKPQNINGEICTKIQRRSPYLDVCQCEAASIFPMMKLQPKQRHVQISAKNRYPNGLRHLLSVTNSMFITDDAFVRCLTDLNYSLICLEECQLQRCHQMTEVFRMNSEASSKSEVFPSLRILQASCLENLLCFVKPVLRRLYNHHGPITLKVLKHIHVEHCPRLEKIFPCSLSLPALETLVILFCYNLKTIFYNQPDYYVAASPLPNIERIYLQELPHLQHFHDDVTFQFDTPKWEKLFVRGCLCFQSLPLLKKEYQKLKVEVSGERDWWGRLQWILPEQSDYYLHVPPPEFVSRKKHIIKSYLR